MSFFPGQAAILGSILALLVVSCSQSKVAQCNQITELINKADAATQGAKTNQPEILSHTATKLDQVTSALEGIQVNDEKLQGLQSSFAMMYNDVSKGFRNLAKASQRQDVSGVAES